MSDEVGFKQAPDHYSREGLEIVDQIRLDLRSMVFSNAPLREVVDGIRTAEHGQHLAVAELLFLGWCLGNQMKYEARVETPKKRISAKDEEGFEKRLPPLVGEWFKTWVKQVNEAAPKQDKRKADWYHRMAGSVLGKGSDPRTEREGWEPKEWSHPVLNKFKARAEAVRTPTCETREQFLEQAERNPAAAVTALKKLKLAAAWEKEEVGSFGESHFVRRDAATGGLIGRVWASPVTRDAATEGKWNWFCIATGERSYRSHIGTQAEAKGAVDERLKTKGWILTPSETAPPEEIPREPTEESPALREHADPPPQHVLIRHNDETGVWQWSVEVKDTDFWLGSFPTLDEAREYCAREHKALIVDAVRDEWAPECKHPYVEDGRCVDCGDDSFPDDDDPDYHDGDGWPPRTTSDFAYPEQESGESVKSEGQEAALDEARSFVKEHMTADTRPPSSAGVRILMEIRKERLNQIAQWSLEHDDQHLAGDLTNAASVLMAGDRTVDAVSEALSAPIWATRYRESHELRRRLVAAAALVVAEIERLDRLARPRTPEPFDQEAFERSLLDDA